ncbi:DUF4389 domain-containing protein [Candidatus Micrarchaeota archaeon]|nr:DUF4389 domain-containing protein [Candidatus Micrarchaeota archaeon]
MKTVKCEITYVEKASRLELFIRLLWMIPTCIVFFFLMIIASILNYVQWIYILILGKRHKGMHDWLVKYVAYTAKFDSYLLLLTDERNPIMPED